MSKTKWYHKPIYLLVALALVLSLGIAAVPEAELMWAHPGTIQVDVNDPGCVTGHQVDPYSVVYCSIQDAIDDASPGDVINVAAGTYDESITLEGGVQVLGAGADVTTIDGSTARSGQPAYHVVVGANDATLDGFTVTGGNASGPNENDRCGGGMFNYYSSPTVTNCIFSGNSANLRGGGMYNRGSSPTVTNCIFSGNSATGFGSTGGGMGNNYHSSPTVTNCIFEGNSAQYGGGMWNWSYSSPHVTSCIFEGNSAGNSGGVMYNEWYCSPTVTNCIFEGNSASSGGGGILSRDWSSPTVTNCIFEGNSAGNSGGVMYNYENSSPTLTNCRFSGNSAEYGGGMYNTDHSSPTMTNCIFEGNSAIYRGGGMCNWGSSPTVTNCIFSGNSASGGSGMSNFSNASPRVTNCIFWDNYDEIYATASTPVVTYCDIRGGYPGVGNIDTDPLFVNPANNDYHPQAGSPCIDAGTNVGAPTEDIEGTPRPIDGDGDGWAITDMGAYEYVPPTPPAHFRYLHAEDGLFNLTDPVGTQWHELWPILSREYHLSSWNDTSGNGVLSRCDRIDMYQKPDGEVKWYHVENVTITLYLTPETMGGPMYIELEGGYNSSVLTNPLGTQWHQIYPVLARQYQLSSWNDTDEMGKLDPCDDILLTPKAFYGPVRCPLDEDFSGGFPPSEWKTDVWKQSNSNRAGGTPSEARLWWKDISGNYSYLDSKPINTTGLPCLTLEFKSYIADYVDFCPDHPPFDCRVCTRAHGGDSWTDVTPWSNPIYGNVRANTYSLDISSDIGNATQVRFEFDGDSSCLPNSWYVDDVRICYPEPTWWHVEEVAIDIIVTPEPPPVGGEAYPVNKPSLLAPWISLAVLLAGGISWYVLRRRKVQS